MTLGAVLDVCRSVCIKTLYLKGSLVVEKNIVS